MRNKILLVLAACVFGAAGCNQESSTNSNVTTAPSQSAAKDQSSIVTDNASAAKALAPNANGLAEASSPNNGNTLTPQESAQPQQPKVEVNVGDSSTAAATPGVGSDRSQLQIEPPSAVSTTDIQSQQEPSLIPVPNSSSQEAASAVSPAMPEQSPNISTATPADSLSDQGNTSTGLPNAISADTSKTNTSETIESAGNKDDSSQEMNMPPSVINSNTNTNMDTNAAPASEATIPSTPSSNVDKSDSSAEQD